MYGHAYWSFRWHNFAENLDLDYLLTVSDVDGGDDEDAAADVDVVDGHFAVHANQRGSVEWQPTIPVHPMGKGLHSLHLRKKNE